MSQYGFSRRISGNQKHSSHETYSEGKDEYLSKLEAKQAENRGYMMEELCVIDPKVEEAFHMMWGSFPAPVRLIHKNKKVLAVNVAAKRMGLNPSEHCFKVGTPAQHKACKAHEALASNQGIQALNAEKDTIRFWLPVQGCPDVYVHFPLKLSTILE